MDKSLYELEKRAMTSDKAAVLVLVSRFRDLRQAAERLLLNRYRDGKCDVEAISQFEVAYINATSSWEEQ